MTLARFAGRGLSTQSSSAASWKAVSARSSASELDIAMMGHKIDLPTQPSCRLTYPFPHPSPSLPHQPGNPQTFRNTPNHARAQTASCRPLPRPPPHRSVPCPQPATGHARAGVLRSRRSGPQVRYSRDTVRLDSRDRQVEGFRVSSLRSRSLKRRSPVVTPLG